MLNIYTDKGFLTETHRSYVFPLLFDLHYLRSKKLLNHYQIIEDIKGCDVIIFPIDYGKFLSFNRDLNNLLSLSKKYKKPIWVYTSGDFGFTVHIHNVYNFRLGGFDSLLDGNTFIMPSFVNDPYEKINKKFDVVDKSSVPIIGFVGHAKAGVVKYLKEYMNHLKLSFKKYIGKLHIDKQPFYPSSTKRFYYLNKLKQSSGLETKFVLKDKYRGGVKTEEEKRKSVQDFYNNIYHNLYTFCMRGTGNFSVRFYETLAMGRIPILLNTDCRLPLSNLIDWENHCLILEDLNNTQGSIQEQILKFHNSKTYEEIIEIQRNNRLLWKRFLTREAFFIKVHDILRADG